MRREVNQSLFLWPALASASIIAVVSVCSRLATLHTPLLSNGASVADSQWDANVSAIDNAAIVRDRAAPLCTIAIGEKSSSSDMLTIDNNGKISDGTAPIPLPEPGELKLIDFGYSSLANLELPAIDSEEDDSEIVVLPAIEIAPLVVELKPPIIESESAGEDRTAKRFEDLEEIEIEAPSNLDLDAKIVAGVVEESADPAELAIDHEGELSAARKMIDDIRLASPLASLKEHEEEVTESVIPKSIRNLADLARKPETKTAEPKIADRAEKITKRIQPSANQNSPASWPIVKQLNEDLTDLASLAESSDAETSSTVFRWTEDVRSSFDELSSLDRLGNRKSGEVLQRLSVLVDDGYATAEICDDRTVQIVWLKVCYDVKKRVDLWIAVHEVAKPEIGPIVPIDIPENRGTVVAALEETRSFIELLGDAGDWQDYLLLDEIDGAFASGDAQQRRKLSHQLLLRANSSDLSQSQTAWIQQPQIQQLIDSIRPWAAEAIDHAALLQLIEQHDSQAISFVESKIMKSIQSLRLVNSAKAQRVVHAFDQHYRNANIRIAVSEQLLRRMLPPVEPHTMPVQTSVFGSRIRGVSHVRSKVDLDLIPSSGKIIAHMKTQGHVQTQSYGQSQGADVNTLGSSYFSSVTPVSIFANGYTVGASTVEVRGRTRLRGLNTQYDQLPIIGVLANNIARSRYGEISGATSRIANRRIKNKLTEEIDQRARERMNRRGEQLSQNIIQPLNRLALAPTPVELRTTDDRMVSRYRLAGSNHLTANTPRPRALQSSLLSMQVHQSALNNLFERLVPREESRTLMKTLEEGFAVFNRTNVELPADLPGDVEMKFIKENPITFEFEDGTAWLTLRVVRLTRGEKVKLSRFIIRAAYKPEVNGMEANLVRDGHLRISGPGMSMRQRLPLRAIFNKVLATSNKLPLLPAAIIQHPELQKLAIQKLEIRHGWIAMSIGDKLAPQLNDVANVQR